MALSRDDVREIQISLNAHGYGLVADGIMGPNTHKALMDFLRRDDADDAEPGAGPLAWGAHVSPAFRAKVRTICDDFGWTPEHADWLMACMAFETGRTFNPSEKNRAGSGATGLIQFMPTTAEGLGTTTDALAQMTAEDQLDFVMAYFQPYARRIDTLEDMYMAILMPRYVGSPADAVLFSNDHDHGTWNRRAYFQNRGLDLDKDGRITKEEASAHVFRALKEGRETENLGPEMEA